MVKYCPMCTYTTAGNKLIRHIINKHNDRLRKPRSDSVKEICKIITIESRKSYTMLPMAVMRETVDPFWDDRSYRKTAHK